MSVIKHSICVKIYDIIYEFNISNNILFIVTNYDIKTEYVRISVYCEIMSKKKKRNYNTSALREWMYDHYKRVSFISMKFEIAFYSAAQPTNMS